MLKLKLQYFGHLMQRADSLEKILILGKTEGRRRRRQVGWHHWLDGHESEQAPGVGDGQGSLACCSPWGRKESDMTEWLNWMIRWKDWCWSWSSNTLAAWWEELTHWKKLWYCERLKAGGDGGDRGWDGWMASLTQWTWVWTSSRSCWWIGKPGVLQSMGSQRVRHNWETELMLILITGSWFLFPSSLIVLFWRSWSCNLL